MRSAVKFSQFLVLTMLLSLLTGTAALAVTDDFLNPSAFATNWSASPDMVLSGGNLHCQATLSGWNYYAIYKGSGVTNPNSASITFSPSATTTTYSGVLFVNGTTAAADGYLITKKGNSLRLFKVTDGQVPASGYSLATATANPDISLAAGGTMTVVVNTAASDYTFSVSVNGTLVGVLTDPTPGDNSTNLSTVYAGVMIYGTSDAAINSDIDSFTAIVASTSGDSTPPAAIGSLTVNSTTSSTASLSWPVTSDNVAVTQYDLRYSTSSITASNFGSATQASGEPTPKSSGTESFTVTGLSASTTYYFAIRAGDALSNWSSITTSSPAKTATASSGTVSTGWKCADPDAFSRTSVGSDWAAPTFTIVNGQLTTATTANGSSWSNLAVYTKSGMNKTPEVDSLKVSYTIGADAQKYSNLFVPVALAVLLDSPSTAANGYWLKRTNNALQLNKISDNSTVASTTSLKQTTPAAGDKVTAVVKDLSSGKQIDFFINDKFDATLNVTGVTLETWYAGVVIYDNKQIYTVDNFEVCFPGSATPDAAQMDEFYGNNQTGPINTELPDSVAVRVTDNANLPVEGAVISFSVTEGRATLSVDTNEFDGKIWKECEDATLGGLAFEATDTGASGGKYVSTPDTVNQTGTVPLTMTFYSPQDLIYDFWLRCRASDSKHNRGYFKLDDKDSLAVSAAPISSSFVWYKVGYYTVSRGVHTIKFYVTKNPGWDWDKVALWDRIKYREASPSGTGGAGPLFSNVSNADGIASTRVTFGTDADTNVVVQAMGYTSDGQTMLNGAPVNFTLDPTPGPAYSLAKGTKLDTLKGTAGQRMTDPIQALVLDSYGNRVPGVTVRFSIVSGDGTLSTASAVSNEKGEANTYLTLSLLGTFYAIEATATDNGGVTLRNAPVTFYVKPGVPPKQIQYVSGNDQTGLSCDRLANPLIVKVIGNNDLPFATYPVEFKVTSGGGSVSALSPESYSSSVTIKTNSEGLAQVYWKPGALAGINTVEAQTPGLAGSPIVFTATGNADVAAVLKIVSGNVQQGPVGVNLEKPLVVKITDKCGENPIAGFPVVFTVIQGTDAYLDNPSNLNKSVTVMTNDQGLAQVNLFIGSLPSEQHLVRATAAGMNPETVTFTATSTAAVAIALEYISGSFQDTTVTKPLSQPLVVRTLGPYDAPISGQTVKFAVTKGNGNINGQTFISVVSDAQGLARANLTIGTAAGDSANIVEATSTRSDNVNLQLKGSPVRFIAAGVADVASRVERDEATNAQSGTAGAPLLKDIRARVLDQFGNPIFDYPVTFEIKADGGTFITGTTESTVQISRTGKDGYAAAKWKMPTSLGPVSCTATAAKENGVELSGSPVSFSATSVTGEAYKMVSLTTADTLSGIAGKPLSQLLRVRVTDRNDLPKGGYFVTFLVTKGGGSLSNGLTSASTQTVATSVDSGIAEVTWTLGTVRGVANNVVQARAAVTVNPTLTFQATAKPDIPSRLIEDKTVKDQVGKVGVALAQPIKVQIVDQYGNGVPNHAVVFTVQGADSVRGNIDGLATKTVPTDIDGFARVNWVLGKRPGSRNNIMEVTSRHINTLLTNAPYVFYATAILGDPALIVMKSDTAKLSAGTTIGAALSEPLRVRVTDMFSNPIANQEVVFEVMSTAAAGGGSLDGVVDSKKTVLTDSYGMASVLFYCGNKYGYKINRVEARAEYASQKLNGSPVTFFISGRASNAAKIQAKGGNNQNGTVGQYLLEELQVMAMDQYGNGVSGHPITFRVTTGAAEKSSLGADTLTTKVVETGPDGIARVAWKLGRVAGADKNMVEATSTNGSTPLAGAPLLFKATAAADITDAKRSQIQAFPVEVPADGASKSVIQVTLRDQYDNLVSKKAVLLSASNTSTHITGPTATTDDKGQATGYVTATSAGVTWLKARDLNSQVTLADSVRVTFKALAAFEIVMASTNHGDAQEANVATALTTPLRVYVRDKYGNPIRNFPVTFVPTQGGGQMLDGPQVFTDSTGLAQARYLLGPAEGVNFIEARAFDQTTGAALSNSPVRFTETGKKSKPSFLVKVSGDDQSAAPGQQLVNPLKVRVLDLNNKPIWGVEVKFGVLLNDGNVISTNPVKTDMNGEAQASVVVGFTQGTNLYSAHLPEAPAIQTLSFRATTINGTASRLVYIAGNQQKGTVNRTLPQLLTVSTEDDYGNKVANVPVNFSVVDDATVLSVGALAGGVKSAIVRSGPDGIASITYTPGTRAGLNKVVVTAAGLQPVSIPFMLYGKADVPHCMTDASVKNLRGQVGKTMIDPIQVLVSDQYGNPAQNGMVQFVVMPQSGSLVGNNVVYSDSTGVAAAHWVLGKAGANVALATALLPCGATQITFNATGETNNYPVLSLPGDHVINELQQLLLTISASDGDGDQLYINALRLPEGAVFNEPAGSYQLNWTPTPNQGRTDPYYAVFEALDSRGGRDLDSIKITVRNDNAAPQLVSKSPVDQYALVPYQSTQEFIVQVMDPDGDQLSYSWKVDNAVVGNSSAFFFDSRYYTATSQHMVSVEVSDGVSSIISTWVVDIRSAVEMKTFTCAAVPYQGVKLEWETASETGNLGFHVYRSLSEAGKYDKINAELVPACEDGKYTFIDQEAHVGRKYYYKIEDMNTSGATQTHGPVLAEVAAPENYDLAQNYPNPFNPTTNIRFQLPQNDQVRIQVFNLTGQLVCTLVDGKMPAGYHMAVWDGRDEYGVRVGSGIYYYRLTCQSFSSTKKMALLK